MAQYRYVSCAGVLILAAASGDAQAQSIALPQVDDVNFFLQAGGIFPGGDIRGNPRDDLQLASLTGWGFETLFTMRSTPNWNVELAVGYSQLFMRARLDDRYELRGTVRNFPTTSLYATHRSSGFYVGVGTGPVSLSNVTAHSAGQPRFSVGGETFDLVAHFGKTFDLMPKDGLGLFFEASYHARFIGGLTYGAGAPSFGLPPSAYMGGGVISIGLQVSLKPAKKAPAPDEEINRQRGTVVRSEAHTPDTEATMKSWCADKKVPAGWVKVDTRWDPASCGAPTAPSDNVWIIADSSAPSTALLEVCSDAKIPDGWSTVGKRWSRDRCGQPSDPTNHNVTQIERSARPPVVPPPAPAPAPLPGGT